MKIVIALLILVGQSIVGAFMGAVFWYLGSMTLTGLQLVPMMIAGAIIAPLIGLAQKKD